MNEQLKKTKKNIYEISVRIELLKSNQQDEEIKEMVQQMQELKEDLLKEAKSIQLAMAKEEQKKR